MSSKDKRRYERVKAKNVSAHLSVADQTSPCAIQNISAGGIFIETASALPVGMPVAVSLTRPGWTKVLRVCGRVVWAMAERTAAKKGVLPGMRIKYDPLSRETADELMALLKELGASTELTPPLKGEELHVPAPKEGGAAITQPASMKEIQARHSQSELKAAQDPTLPPGPSVGSTFMTPAHRPAVAPAPAPVPSAPRFATGGNPTSADNPRLLIQVQGLLMQLGDLQQRLELREREVAALNERLKEKDAQLDRVDRERKAAELAIQRLSMQLSSRR